MATEHYERLVRGSCPITSHFAHNKPSHCDVCDGIWLAAVGRLEFELENGYNATVTDAYLVGLGGHDKRDQHLESVVRGLKESSKPQGMVGKWASVTVRGKVIKDEADHIIIDALPGKDPMHRITECSFPKNIIESIEEATPKLPWWWPPQPGDIITSAESESTKRRILFFVVQAGPSATSIKFVDKYNRSTKQSVIEARALQEELDVFRPNN